VVGCLLWRRDLVVRREAAIGGLIAGALVLPNVIWQGTHGWISLDFASSQHDATAADSSPFVYAAQQVLFLGLGAMLVVFGLVWLWRRPHLRPLALASAAPTVLFALEQGRSYYALPALLPALVAGCLAVAERRPRRTTLVAFGGLHLVLLVIAVPLVVPVLPVRQLVSTGTWNVSFWKDELGWRELTAQAAAAWHSRTPAERDDAALIAVNYGTAGALALDGPETGLPPPLSGHLSYQDWHPARMPQRHALLVGFDRKSARERCSEVSVLDVVDNRWHVDNDTRGYLIIWCRLRAPLGQMWQESFVSSSL
jgi:hypothetical protein